MKIGPCLRVVGIMLQVLFLIGSLSLQISVRVYIYIQLYICKYIYIQYRHLRLHNGDCAIELGKFG